jgi:hypothetical protein
MIGSAVKLGLLVGVLALIGVALFRPATLFGVDGKALASSVGGNVAHSTATCVGAGSGAWRCEVTGGNALGAEYTVRTHRFGCWSGTLIDPGIRRDPPERSVSGCIGLTDLFGH